MRELRIPKFGMSTVEVEILEILVTHGQVVAVGDPIVQVETDKVNAVVEAEFPGTVSEIRVEVGETYDVGDVLCVFEDAKDA